MPRIKQKAAEYAAEDFVKEVKIRMIEVGIDSERQLAHEIGITPPTFCKRKQNVKDFSVGELQAMVRTISPDPIIVLKLLGYSSRDISKALSLMTTAQNVR